MNLPGLKRLNSYQKQMIVLVTILIVVVILFVNNRRSIAKLERQQEKLDSINKELDLKEAIHQKRVKEFEEQTKKNQERAELLKEEIDREIKNKLDKYGKP